MGQALHMSNERSCTCQIYIAGSRQTTVSDSVPRSLALHVSVMLGALAFTRTNAAGFQREALPIVSMFARFHPWWTQVQVPSSPTSVSSSNEVRKFSLLNLELSLAVGHLQQTPLRRALLAPILQAPSIRTSLASRSRGQGDFCRLDGEAE